MGRSWAIVSGEFSPQPGGVADYTFALANGLSSAGDSVVVYAPGRDVTELPGHARIVRIRSGFAPAGLATLARTLLRAPLPQVLLVQYVAQSFGLFGVNLPFVILLALLGRRIPLWVMYHEYAIAHDPSERLPRQIRAWGTRLAAGILARSAQRVFVSTAAWVPRVRAAAPNATVCVTPIFSNLPTVVDGERVASVRANLAPDGAAIVGHFGTYRMTESREYLDELVPQFLRSDRAARFLLLGRDSDTFAIHLRERAPDCRERILATGAQERDRAAESIAACDVLLQPYSDGATTRRGSLLAGLALGVATVTTLGASTEDLWRGCDAVAFVEPGDVAGAVARLLDLLADPVERDRLAHAARRFYHEWFEISRTIDSLRAG
jgi:glycosyltransferase involved in cell wall biosynthesis